MCLDQRLRAKAYEIFQTLGDLNPNFMKEIFCLCPNLTHKKDNLYVHSRNTAKPRNKSLRSLGTHIWNSLPENIEYVVSLQNRHTNSKIL